MIDRNKFIAIMAYVTAGVQQSLSEAGLHVYLDCLGDLSEEVLWTAAKRAVMVHKYATFPPVALLRELAAEASKPVGEVGAHEAWKLAYRAACSIDPGNNSVYQAEGKLWDSQVAYRMAKLPPLVAEAVLRFGGLKLLADADGEFARKQFVDAYAEVVSTTRQARTLPAPTETAAQVLKAGKVSSIGVDK